MPILTLFGGAFASIISFLIKHPFVLKMMIFSVFTSLITVAFSYLKDIVSPYVVSNPLLSLPAYFGILDGLSVYITILVAGFGVKQILAFVRS